MIQLADLKDICEFYLKPKRQPVAIESLKKEILEQIESLGPAEQRQLLEFAKQLSHDKPIGVPGKSLLSFAGTISVEDLDLMEKAIEEACERIDLDEG